MLDSCWMWLRIITEKHTFHLLTGRFLRFSWTCWKNKSTVSVWWQFKNSKWIIQRWSHHTHSIDFSSMKLRFWGRLRRFILVNSLPVTLNIVIKYPFFVTCKDILEKWIISLPWKKTCCYGYAIFLILLNLLDFSFFFNWHQIMDWDVLKSINNSRLLLRILHSTNSLNASWSRFDKRPVLGSSLNEVSS